jgi:hypothetical protein
MTESQGALVTPFLSKDDRAEISEWNARNTYNNSFYRVIRQVGNISCQNCGDAGFIVISFTKAGPFESVPGHAKDESLTYFEGNQFCGKGWYIVKRTVSYPCSNCRAG